MMRITINSILNIKKAKKKNKTLKKMKILINSKFFTNKMSIKIK